MELGSYTSEWVTATLSPPEFKEKLGLPPHWRLVSVSVVGGEVKITAKED